jgi:hypothetical protein
MERFLLPAEPVTPAIVLSSFARRLAKSRRRPRGMQVTFA